MKFILNTIALAGHTYPMAPMATELTSRGHSVVWITGPSMQRLVESTGAQFVSTNQLTSVDEALRPHPEKWGIWQVVYLLRQMVTNRTLGQIADFRPVLKTFAADCIVIETVPLGAQAMYEMGEIPAYATLGIFPMYSMDPIVPPPKSGRQPPKNIFQRIANRLWFFWSSWFVYRTLPSVINRDRFTLGLPPLSRVIALERMYQSKLLHIEPACPSFEFPRSKIYPNIHFVGPLIPAVLPDHVLPSWWDEMVAHPRVIHITQGTYVTFAQNLTLPAIRALGPNPNYLLIITVPENDTTFNDTLVLPPNVRVHTYIPHSLLLPHCNLVITNAGHGGVKAAIKNGVPLICAGQSEDKMDVSARVAWSGCGIDLKTDRPSEKQIRDAVDTVLGDPTYTETAQRLAAEAENLGGAQKACDLLEKLVVDQSTLRQEI